ncbi:hypothetical protein VDF71_05540 [Xanthomonas campestris pv. raphani]|uniref:hypothetical protein n=1 Tax=Xanthomonas campestris TaxID=339 RepID=UPI002B235E0F|nr:hypothetical protein [Xanthomonas campestris]MEA9770778.1 hypothetical protein [Xanthomonas campestris pv. raphani]MEA9799323.1 hypothetical protein [Xanthomonas campestris pv. raphani]
MGTPYENQILGAFVFALGVECGKAGTFMPANLFQQTPLDGTFGDLVVGADWCLAFEFKREEGTVDWEKAKWSKKALQAFETDTLLMVASRKAHLLCFSRPKADGIDLFAVSYASALGLGTPKAEFECDHLIKGLVHLVGDTIPETKKKIGLPPDELEAYLRKLASYRKQGSGGRKATWLAVAKSNDGLKIRTSSSLEQLLESRHTLARSPAQQQSRSVWRGPTLGSRDDDEQER